VGKPEYFARCRGADHTASLGPGILGAAFPDYYGFVFIPSDPVVERHRWWAVMVFLDRRYRTGLRSVGTSRRGAASLPDWRWASAAVRLHRSGGMLMYEVDRPRQQTWQFVMASAWPGRHRAADPDPADGKN